MKKKKLTIDTLCIMLMFVMIVVVFTAIMGSKTLDKDLLWHYKLGEEIVKTGRISSDNTFTFLKGTKWIPQEWLYEVMIYIVISLFGTIGYIGLYFVNSVLALILTVKYNKNCKNIALLLVVYTAVMVLTARNIGNRPSEFSVYFAVFIIWLYNKEIQSNYRLLIYLFLGAFAANFHGGSLLTLVAIELIMIFSDIVSDIHNKEKLKISKIMNSIFDTFVLMLGSLINPSGAELLTTIVKIPSLNTTKYIQEWGPFETTLSGGVLIGLIIISFGYYIGKHGVIKEDLRVILVSMALLILSLHSAKAFMVFDLCFMVYGYKYIEEFVLDMVNIEVTGILKKIINIGKTFVPAALVIVIVASPGLIKINKSNNFIEYANTTTSEKIIKELKKNYTNKTKILAGYVSGNYLIGNDMKCFVDTRQWPYSKELYGCDALDKLFDIGDNSDNYEKISKFISEYDFDYIWTSKEFNINQYLKSDKHYELVVYDKKHKQRLWKHID